MIQPLHTTAPWHYEDTPDGPAIIDANGTIVAIVQQRGDDQTHHANLNILLNSPQLLDISQLILMEIECWPDGALAIPTRLQECLSATIQAAAGADPPHSLTAAPDA